MAELADALDLGSSGETRTGSIPARRTKLVEIVPQKLDQIGTMLVKNQYNIIAKKTTPHQYFSFFLCN